MNIHNILKIYKRDLKSIARNIVALIIVVGICVIPSLYAWVNIKACWDPYDNTGTIPVAVVNNDKTITFKDKEINIGNNVITNLKSNHKIGWQFVSKRDAELGLVDSTYYAMIEIPEDFSKDFISILTDKPVKPQITYKVDTKVNPVANKITDVAKNTLVEQITSNFISTVNETIFSSLNSIGQTADTNKNKIISLKDSIVTINKNMDVLTSSLKSVDSNSTNLSIFLNNLKATMPAVNSGLDTLLKQSQNNKEIIKSTQNTLTTSINNIQYNLNSAQTSGSKIQTSFKSLNEALSNAQYTKANVIIPGINVEIDSLNSSIDTIVQYLEECNNIDFNSDIAKAITSLKNTKTSLANIKKQLKDVQQKLGDTNQKLDASIDFLNNQISQINTKIDSINSSLSMVISVLEGLPSSDYPQATQIINAIKTVQTSLTSIKDKLISIQKKISDIKQVTNETVNSICASITNMNTEIDKMNTSLDAAISFLQAVMDTNNVRKAELSKIIVSLKNIKPYLSDEKSQFTTIQQKLNETNNVNKNMLDSVNNDISKTNKQLTDTITQYNDKAKASLTSIGNNLVTATDDAIKLLNSAKDLNKQIENLTNLGIDGSNLAAQVSTDLNNKLMRYKDVIKQLGDKLEFVNNTDVAQMISIMQSNPKLMGNYISNPFDIKDESINEIPNYGSSMTPIYTVLALWVGCLMLTSILKTSIPDFEGSENFTLREKHFGKMLIFITLATVQALIVSIGDKYLLGVYTVSTPLMIIFAVVSSITFSIITYTLVSVLGNVGKALAIIYMILQLAGSGGTYPIQVDPLIFRILQPLFPFTYSVGGFREAIAGPLPSGVAIDFFALFLFAIAFLLFGFFCKEPLHGIIHRFETRFKDSGLGE